MQRVMDQLWAIKQNLYTLPVAIFRSAAYRSRAIFRLPRGAEAAFIGTGKRYGWRRARNFWGGSRWPDTSSRKRGAFIVPITLAGRLGGTAIFGATCACTAFATRSAGQAFAGLFAVFTLLIPVFLGFRWLRIVRFLRSYNERMSSRIV